MIHIEFDNESNIPEETVQAAAQEARRYDARLRAMHGVSSSRVASTATTAAGRIAALSKEFTRIRGRFADTEIDATPMRPDYRAALDVNGGFRPRHLPWLACERAIQGEYDILCRRVGFQLTVSLRVPPATVTLNLSQREDDAIVPEQNEATLRVGVAEVPFAMHLPEGMTAEDLASAVEVLLPTLHKSAVTLWVESAGGTQEVF